MDDSNFQKEIQEYLDSGKQITHQLPEVQKSTFFEELEKECYRFNKPKFYPWPGLKNHNYNKKEDAGNT